MGLYTSLWVLSCRYWSLCILKGFYAFLFCLCLLIIPLKTLCGFMDFSGYLLVLIRPYGPYRSL